MGDAWLDDVERVPNAHSEGGTYVDGVPWRWVGHTTEVIPSSVLGARGLAGRHATPPHLWAWPEEDWLVQTVRLDRSAFALLHPQGTPETNKMRALQVEVIGYAESSPDKPGWWLDWIGRNVVARLIDAGYPIDLDQIAVTTGRDGAGTSGKVRMSRAIWRTFGGLCVHANVPDNHHWDMGDVDLERIAAAARPASPLFHQENDMLLVIQASTGNLWLLESGGSKPEFFGRRTLLNGTTKTSALKSSLPRFEADDDDFEELVRGRERIQ